MTCPFYRKKGLNHSCYLRGIQSDAKAEEDCMGSFEDCFGESQPKAREDLEGVNRFLEKRFHIEGKIPYRERDSSTKDLMKVRNNYLENRF